MQYRIDVVRLRDGVMKLHGWAFGRHPEAPVGLAVYDEQGRNIPAELERVRRDDVAETWFPEYVKLHGGVEREMGFSISFPFEHGQTLYLLIHTDGKFKRVKYNDRIVQQLNSVAYRRREKLKSFFTVANMKYAFRFMRENGVYALYKKSLHKMQGVEEEYDYFEWYKKTSLSPEALEKQRSVQFAYEPKFSIVIPVYNTPEKFLRMLLNSIQKQTYRNFEVCFADATPYAATDGAAQALSPREVIAEYSRKDARIRYRQLGENLGIADNTNEAIRMAEGDFIVLADHDDELTPDALYECARVLNEHPEVQLLYSDEDKIDFDSIDLFEPHFKSDYNPDMLRSVNYICHLFVAKRSLLDAVAETDAQGRKVYERKAYDGAQDYDLILRCCEEAERIERALMQQNTAETEQALHTSAVIYHIRKVLYHWRCHRGSTAARPEAKLYAFEAGARAVYDHCKRIGLPIVRVEKGITYGYYHCIYENQNPLISVIIPNKDHTEDLDKAIRSVLAGSYQQLEFIVVENNSTEAKTREYYERIQKELPCVRVVRWEREFNYSAINNFGVQYAKGEYLLFMNNDIEMIAPDSITELLGFVQRDDVGIAGAKLLYEDGTIQHAGVVVGFGGIAGHTFIGLHDTENTYMHRAKCVQDYSAVTAACFLSKRSVFEAAGGFTEALAVAFNDIDYCMKVRAQGKLVVYTPYASFYHYESKSRGLEDTPEKVARFNAEIVKFAKRWPEILRKGDPYYHPALTLRKSNFALRDLLQEKPGEPYPLEILKDIV